MKYIYVKEGGSYTLISQYANGYYLGYREDDNWGRATEKDWAVIDKDSIVEYQFRSKYKWRGWLTDTIKRFGKRTKV